MHKFLKSHDDRARHDDEKEDDAREKDVDPLFKTSFPSSSYSPDIIHLLRFCVLCNIALKT